MSSLNNSACTQVVNLMYSLELFAYILLDSDHTLHTTADIKATQRLTVQWDAISMQPVSNIDIANITMKFDEYL